MLKFLFYILAIAGSGTLWAQDTVETTDSEVEVIDADDGYNSDGDFDEADADDVDDDVDREPASVNVEQPAPSVVVVRDKDEEAEDEESSAILSLAGVATQHDNEFDDDRDMNWGGAILLEGNINDRFGVETGAMVVERQYEASAAGVTLTSEVTRIHVPVIARLWASDFFSIGLGPYVSFATGDVETSVGDAEFETGADEDTEFGADFAATLNFAVADKTGLFAEGRYSLPFEDASDEESHNLSALAGLKLDL